jgi:hypothetical protein
VRKSRAKRGFRLSLSSADKVVVWAGKQGAVRVRVEGRRGTAR